MRVLVLGASGIIGQHMALDIPGGVKAVFACRTRIPGFRSCDVTNFAAMRELLGEVRPHVIVNLAGESRPDVVEKHPEDYTLINVGIPKWLGLWTGANRARLIQVSSQAVFSGRKPAYMPNSGRLPVNEYGYQKVFAEDALADQAHVTIVRPTFVLGVRPMAHVGRANPVELMLEGQSKQVSDRYFSPSFAPDVASCLWDAAIRKPAERIVHAGVPVRVSRYEIARDLGLNCQPVSNDIFPGIAPRPLDTTYAPGSRHIMSYELGLADCLRRYRHREMLKAA